MEFLFTDMNFTTYILYSKKLDKYYIGYTSNIDDRLIRHNQNSSGFTGRATDWEVVFTKHFSTKTAAYAYERKIKSWKSRDKIMELIKSS